MANVWELDGKTASDDTNQAIYQGTKAKEIWYKGQKIWDSLPNFWRFARPSSLAMGVAFRDRMSWLMYLEAHAEEYESQTDYTFPTASLGGNAVYDELGLDEQWAAWAINVGNDKHHYFYPPYVTSGASWFHVGTADYNGRTLNLAIDRTADVTSRHVLDCAVPGMGTFDWNQYQYVYPFDTVHFAGANVPPGKYAIALDGMISAQYMTRQWVSQNYGNYRYWAINTEYQGETDRKPLNDSLSYLGGSRSKSTYTLTTDRPAQLSADVDIGGGTGNAGTSFTGRLTASVTRSCGYFSGVRPGQLRGVFSTEPRGKGTIYNFVVNDMRGAFPGYAGIYNIDPTLVIDPETGGVVEAECIYITIPKNIFNGNYFISNGNGLIAAYTMKRGDKTIYVRFYEQFVKITSGAKELTLHYWQGSEDYGKNWGGIYA